MRRGPDRAMLRAAVRVPMALRSAPEQVRGAPMALAAVLRGPAVRVLPARVAARDSRAPVMAGRAHRAVARASPVPERVRPAALAWVWEDRDASSVRPARA